MTSVRNVALAFLLATAMLTTSAYAQGNSAAAPVLPRIFSDGVVLQRGTAIPVWGIAAPGTAVTVTLDGTTRRTVARSDSSWSVQFPSRVAGAPLTLTATVGTSTQTVHDIAIGDVWVASGQSNMEWSLAAAKDGAAEVAAAHDHAIREFKVPNTWSWNAERDVAGGTWRAGDSPAVGSFSAVAYFFARELRSTRNVPIGIINSAWSGASIEPYLSREALALDDVKWKAVVAAESTYRRTIASSLEAKIGPLPTRDAGMDGARAPWAATDYDDSAWKPIPVPGAWERNGYAGLDGVVWLRTTFNVTDNANSAPAVLSLGPIDDDDITWINGREVGRTSGYAVPRRYDIPAGVLHAGSNTIAIRVTDYSGDGGVTGGSAPPTLTVGGASQSLAGTWKFRVGVVSFNEDGQHINKIPSILYNRMVHPLLRFPIKGVIWYQGESNSNNDAQARAYQAQFAKLITSWRSAWASATPAFPFLWVQLPNYGTVDVQPPMTAGWALLRESQNAALSLPNTAQAVTVDIGENEVLHPTNKQDVGHRLALGARAVAYREPVAYVGPTYRSMRTVGDSVVLTFDHATGLTSRALNPVHDDTLRTFAIAGADRTFAWAHARIAGNRVIVWSERVAHPVAVRYAWSNGPVHPNLYNAAGLPAAPFRTDHW